MHAASLGLPPATHLSSGIVVDDEFGIAEVLAAFLEDEGDEVAIAVNGWLALDQAATDRPAFVINDLVMPAMDGAALPRAVQADPALAGAPVVVMDELPEESFVERANGYAAFVRKPSGMDDVVHPRRQAAAEFPDPGCIDRTGWRR